jgi:hypothetical protein
MARAQKLAEQGLTHSLKKAPGSKKRKKHANGDSAETEATTEADSKPALASYSQKDRAAASSRSNTSTPTPSASNGIKNASTAMLTARVLEEENEKKRRRKMMGANENISSLFAKSSGDVKSTNSDFMTRGYTMPSKR